MIGGHDCWNMSAMVGAEERVRFCDNCNAVIGWYSTFCEECGLKLGESDGAPKLGVPEAESVERDLFRAHMRLLHRHREQTAILERNLAKSTKLLTKLESGRDPEAQKSILLLSEKLLDFEQDWEDVQHTYNRQSESIEEEFLARIDELEADLELDPEHQEAVDTELGHLMEALEKFEESLRNFGRRLDVVKDRQSSRILSLGAGTGGRLLLFLLAMGLPAAGLAWGIVMGGLDPRNLAIAAAPCVLAIAVLLTAIFSRKF